MCILILFLRKNLLTLNDYLPMHISQCKHEHINNMKKICLALLSLLAFCSAMAQSPRAVVKSIVDGEIDKATEKLNKINIKTRDEMPEMCLLVEAALLSMDSQSDDNKLRGYKMLSTHIDQIRSSTNIEKTFKGNDITCDELIRKIEQNSLNVVIAKDSEAIYRAYKSQAEKGKHSDLELIAEKLEYKIYSITIEKRSIEACKAFLEEFPESEYRTKIEEHAATIRYDEAMASSDEAIMEKFISDYPNYERIDNVSTRLMEHRYKRVVRSESIDDMRWFVDRYPNYHKMDSLKQMMANIEYPTIEDSRKALEAFVEYYPKVRQSGEAKSRIAVFKIIENGTIAEIVQYIKNNGYERYYTRMQRSIAERFGYIILSQDINAVSLIRFRTTNGKIGYLSHDGKVVVEAQYDIKAYTGLDIPSIHSDDVFECSTKRGVAMVAKDNKLGIINSRGELIIPTTYSDIAFLDNEIMCVVTQSSDSEQRTNYLCDIYDYKGTKIAEGRNYKVGPGVADYNNWDTSWFNRAVSIRDLDDVWEKNIYVDSKFIGTAYGGFHHLTPHYRWFQTRNDDKINVISRSGNVVTYNFHSYDIVVVHNNIIMAESISSGNRCIIDLDKQSIISKDKFRDIWAMSDNMILVQYLDNSFGYVDHNLTPKFKERYDRAYSFSCGTAAVIKGSMGYLIDREGKKISQSYDDIAPLAGYKGLYKVMKDGKCGIIDANDDIVINIEYQPIKQSYYSYDKLSTIHCIDGVIEWANGIKTLIFQR